MGAVLSRIRGEAATGVPPFVGLAPDTSHNLGVTQVGPVSLGRRMDRSCRTKPAA